MVYEIYKHFFMVYEIYAVIIIYFLLNPEPKEPASYSINKERLPLYLDI